MCASPLLASVAAGPACSPRLYRNALVLRLTGNFWHNRQMVFDEVGQVCDEASGGGGRHALPCAFMTHSTMPWTLYPHGAAEGAACPWRLSEPPGGAPHTPTEPTPRGSAGGPVYQICVT